MMFVCPGATPVATPAEDTVATAGMVEDQVTSEVMSCVVGECPDSV
jgi:hypothetical protein